MTSFWATTANGITIAVKAQPGAKRDRVLGVQPAAYQPGWPQARLKIAVCAPPEDGRANEAILRLLADALGVRPADCTLRRGAGARDKLIEIDGDGARLAARLAAISR